MKVALSRGISPSDELGNLPVIVFSVRPNALQPSTKHRSRLLSVRPAHGRHNGGMLPILSMAAASVLAPPRAAPQAAQRARHPMAMAEGKPEDRSPWSMESSEALDALRTLDIVITRALDTVEDAWLLARRVNAEIVDPLDCLAAWDDKADTRPRVLVIGSGWAAHAMVKIVDADLYRLLVISPRNFFIFTPMLAASSVGTVEYRSITEPMRASNPRAAFIEGTVSNIDPIARLASFCVTNDITLADGECRQIEYDVCVFAAGVKASVSKVPGVQQHCSFLKELQDAQRLRRIVGSALEQASQPGLSEAHRRRLLTFVVVGGGATGVEYCGELSDFLLDAVGRLYPSLQPLAQVLLLHGGRELLPQFAAPMRGKALSALQASTP